MKNDAMSTLTKVAADLAARRPLHAIDELCDNHRQVSSARLYDMVEESGDILAEYAISIKQSADEMQKTNLDLMCFLKQLSADAHEHGPRTLAAIIDAKLAELTK